MKIHQNLLVNIFTLSILSIYFAYEKVKRKCHFQNLSACNASGSSVIRHYRVTCTTSTAIHFTLLTDVLPVSKVKTKLTNGTIRYSCDNTLIRTTRLKLNPLLLYVLINSVRTSSKHTWNDVCVDWGPQGAPPAA